MITYYNQYVGRVMPSHNWINIDRYVAKKVRNGQKNKEVTEKHQKTHERRISLAERGQEARQNH